MRNAFIGMIVVIMAVLAGSSANAIDNPLDAKAEAMTTAGPEDLVALGNLYIEAMRLDEAKQVYRDALKLQEGFGDAEFGLARIDMALGKMEKAKQACRGVWRRHQDQSVGEICMGWVWLTFERSTRAIEEFQKAVNKGDAARGMTGKGEVFRRRADYEEAKAAYTAAIAADSDYLAHLGIGLVKESQGDLKGALASINKAVEMEPASCEAHYNLGRLLGKGDAAESHLKIAISIRPNWVEAYQQLGFVLLENGKYEDAKNAFNAAIAASKLDKGTLRLGLGKALALLNQPEEALIQLQKALELVPNLVDAYLLIAEIKYNSGDSKAAVEYLEKAMSVASSDVRVWLKMGETYFRLGRYTSANSNLKKAVSMKEDLSIAYVYLGDIACERLLFDSGQEFYDKALKGDMKGVTADDIQKRKSVCKSKH